MFGNIKILDSKHLSRINEELERGRVLPPKAFLKSCVIGHMATCPLCSESHDIFKKAVIVSTVSVKNSESIVDVRMELPRQVSMRSLSFASEAVQISISNSNAIWKRSTQNQILTSKIDTFSLILTCPLLRTVNFYRCLF